MEDGVHAEGVDIVWPAHPGVRIILNLESVEINYWLTLWIKQNESCCIGKDQKR